MDNNVKEISLDDILNSKASSDMAKKSETIGNRVQNSTSSKSNNSRRIVDDITEIAPMRKEPNPQEEFENHYYNLMDNAIERTKKSLYEERIKPWQDKCKELAFEAELNGDADPVELSNMVTPTTQPIANKTEIPEPPTPASTVKEEIISHPEEGVEYRIRSDVEAPKVTSDNLEKDMEKGQEIELDMDDFDDDLSIKDESIDDISKDEEVNTDDELKRIEEEANNKRLLDQLRGELNQHLSFEKVDLNEYSVNNNKININATMNRIAKDTDVFTRTQSVPLYDTGRMISFTPLSGSDIVKLSADNYDSRLETLRKTYSVMYTHDASIDKNKVSFTTWMKTIAAGDLQQLYFGLYKSTFAGSNYIAYKCPECDNFFMVHKDIQDMYSVNKDATDEQKARLKDIEEHSEVDDNIKTRAEMFQVSENFVVLIHPKTLYNTLEIEYLDNKFRDKYSSILQAMQYIEKVFYIDKARKSLIPIDMHPDKDSIVKTIKNKCVIIHKLISAITVEQYSILTGTNYIQNINERDDKVTFQLPETVCPKCGAKIPAEARTPEQLLFTRHQLYINTTLTI